MRRLPHLLIRVMTVLLCATLVLGPAGAFAEPVQAWSGDVSMTDRTSGELPCHKPCDGCGEREAPLSCVASCMGLVAAVPAVGAVCQPSKVVEPVVVAPCSPLVGTHRQPDTPPPKRFFA